MKRQFLTSKVQGRAFGAVQGSALKVQGWEMGTLNLEL
jgi:hypothetical protein